MAQLLPVRSHLTFHIRCISVHNPLLPLPPPALVCYLLRDIPVLWCCHIYQYVSFLILAFNYYIWPMCRNFSIHVPPDSVTNVSSFIYIYIYIYTHTHIHTYIHINTISLSIKYLMLIE